jgi:hypothetical protein
VRRYLKVKTALNPLAFSGYPAALKANFAITLLMLSYPHSVEAVQEQPNLLINEGHMKAIYTEVALSPTSLFFSIG